MFGNNVMEVFSMSKNIINKIKTNPSPFFLQLDTFRTLEHCGTQNDDYLNYRDFNEINFWFNKDPIKLYIEKLKKEKKINNTILNKIKLKLNAEINEAFDFAKNDEFPKINTLNRFIYAKE